MNVLLQGLLVAVVVIAARVLQHLAPAAGAAAAAAARPTAHLPRIGASAWLTALAHARAVEARRRLRLLRAGSYERGFPETNTWRTSPLMMRSCEAALGIAAPPRGARSSPRRHCAGTR